MELRLSGDDDGRYSVIVPSVIDMISRVTQHRGITHDVTVVVRQDALSAAIEHYPHLGAYWWKRFSGEMT